MRISWPLVAICVCTGTAVFVAAGATAAATVVDRESLPGAITYHARCAQCHDRAVYKAPAKSFLQFMAPDAIYSALAAGVMQVQAAQLTEAEKHAVANYLGDADLASAATVVPAPSCGTPLPTAGDQPRLDGWGVDLANSHAIPTSVARLPVAMIPRLKVKWAFAYPGAQRARSQPTVAMGMVYVGSQSGAVYALDAASGCLRWTFRASSEVRTPLVLSHDDSAGQHATRTLAFFGDVVGHLYAVDAVSGVEVWKRRLDEHPSATITGAPAYNAGRLYVPVSSLEEATAAADYECCTFRGSVVAVDAATGRVIWKRYTIDRAATLVGKTAKGTHVYAPSGASVWNSPAIDVKRGLLYVGTGDNYTGPTDDRSDAVLAIDLAGGALRWAHQVRRGDAWNVACMLDNENCPARHGPDFDIGAGTMLIHAAPRRDLIVAGLKSGQVVGLDADHRGKLVWTQRLGRGGTQGGIQFGMAYDEHSIYVPISDMALTHDGKVPAEPPDPGLYALDAATGKLRWSAHAEDMCAGRMDCDPGILASISVIPGAVFAGHMDGWIRAYDTANGRVLWQYDSTQEVTTVSGSKAKGGSVGGGGPIVVDGTVFVNSGYGIYWHMPGNLLLAFSADEK